MPAASRSTSTSTFVAGGPIFVGYGDGTAPATLLEGAGHPHYYAVTMATLNAGGDPAFAGRFNPPPNEQRHLRYRGHDVATGLFFHGTDINDADRIVFAAGDGSADRVYLTDATGAVHTPVLAARASAVAIDNAGLLAALLVRRAHVCACVRFSCRGARRGKP
jgi:hypothetical protein